MTSGDDTLDACLFDNPDIEEAAAAALLRLVVDQELVIDVQPGCAKDAETKFEVDVSFAVYAASIPPRHRSSVSTGWQ